MKIVFKLKMKKEMQVPLLKIFQNKPKWQKTTMPYSLK